MCPLHVWRGGREQRIVIVLKDMSHTFGKPSQTSAWQLECFHFTGKELKSAEEAKKYYLDIVGASSNKRHDSGIVDLDSG